MDLVLAGCAGVKWAQITGIAVGSGLMGLPALFGYSGSFAGAVQRTAGPAIAAAALIAFWEATAGVRWANLPLAVVLAVSSVGGLVVDDGGGAVAAVVGVVAGLAVAASTPHAGQSRHHFGSGWAGLRSATREE